jgi:hypothetical protein
MLCAVALRHLWFHKRLMVILLLAISLVAGFCGVQPLYHARLSDAAARDALATLTEEKANIALNSPQPIGTGAETVLDDALGDLIDATIRVSRAYGEFEAPPLGKICGYDYAEGERLTAASRYASTPADHCYFVYSFAPLRELFDLRAGRWPQPLAPPDTGSADQTRLMGAPQLEAVIAVAVAEQAHVQVGDRLVVGDRFDRTVTVEIVGLVDPQLNPRDVFWHGHTVVLAGEWTQYGLETRFDIGLIVPEETFADWMPTVAPHVIYTWRMKVNRDAINAARLRALDASLYRAESQIRLTDPGIELVSGLPSLAVRYRVDVARFERSERMVAGALLALLLWQLIVTDLWIFDARRDVWAILFRHGARPRQIAGIMLLMAAITGVAGGWAGPLWAWLLINTLGPSALPGANTVTVDALLYSLAGSAVAVMALALPAWAVTRRSQRPPRPWINTPPLAPLWKRYGVDVALLAGGLLLLIRLYLLASGDLGQSLSDLARDPTALARRLSASRTTVDGGLGDPYNLAGPVLILGGGALFWLRILPLALRAPAWALGRQRWLTAPLALWQVTRDPAHHTMLAVTLTATVALGTASFGLTATHDAAAWRAARQDVGADARLTVVPTHLSADPDWTALPGVTTATGIMRADAVQPFVSLLGVEPVTLRATYPDLPPVIDQLAGPVDTLPGLPIDHAAGLELQVYSEPNPDDPGEIGLSAALLDGRGVPHALPMTASGNATGQFVTYRAFLPENQPLPWRVIGFRLASTHHVTHTIYLDDMGVWDDQGRVTTLEDFESAPLSGWVGAPEQPSNIITIERSAERAAQGKASLRIDYFVKFTRYADLLPLLLVTENPTPVLPVVVSVSFVELQRQSIKTAPHLQVGDTGIARLQLPLGSFSLSYRIVGIVRDFPTLSASEPFIIAPLDPLRLLLNATSARSGYYDANQIWLTFGGRAPNSAFRQAAMDLPGVLEAVVAWDRYTSMKREPSLNAISGILRIGFGAAAGLGLLILMTYLALVAPHRAPAAGALRTLGWSQRRITLMLATELLVLVLLTLLAGLALGALLVYLLLPFLTSLETETLRLPVLVIGQLWVGSAALVFVMVVVNLVFFHTVSQSREYAFSE